MPHLSSFVFAKACGRPDNWDKVALLSKKLAEGQRWGLADLIHCIESDSTGARPTE